LYHFRDKARYWSKIAIFHTPCIRRPCHGGTHRSIDITFGTEKTMVWLPGGGKQADDKCSRFGTIQCVTDRHLAKLRRYSPRYAYASRGKKIINEWCHAPQISPRAPLLGDVTNKLSDNVIDGCD